MDLRPRDADGANSYESVVMQHFPQIRPVRMVRVVYGDAQSTCGGVNGSILVFTHTHCDPDHEEEEGLRQHADNFNPTELTNSVVIKVARKVGVRSCGS